MDAYMYRAAFYCEDCIKDIKKSLAKPDYPKPWDSDDYPAGPFEKGGGEADCPQHCDCCQVFLENPLTADGYAYVQEAAEEQIEKNRVVSEWAKYYSFEVISDEM